MHPDNQTYWRYLKFELHAIHRFERHRILLMIIITTTIFLVGLSLIKNNLKDKPSVLGLQTAVTPAPINPAVPPTTAPTMPVLSPTPPIRVYAIAVSSKPAVLANPNLLLSDVLTDAFGLPLITGKPYPLKALALDTTSSSASIAAQHKFDYSYLVVLSSGGALPKSTYESALVRVMVKPADQRLEPYLLNQGFCQQDSDCLIRQSYCNQGVYNRFDPFLENISCVDTTNVTTQKVLTNPRCQANRCQAQVSLIYQSVP